MNEAEFTEWAAGHQRQLLRSAYLLTGDPYRAQDLVQEALTKVAMRWERLRDQNPMAYARTIVVRDNISWWRKRRDVLIEPSDRAAHAQDPEVALVVQRALARLTTRQRAVVVLRHFDDLSEADTASLLGVSVGTVKSTNADAMARLRDGAPELLDLIGRTR